MNKLSNIYVEQLSLEGNMITDGMAVMRRMFPEILSAAKDSFQSLKFYDGKKEVESKYELTKQEKFVLDELPRLAWSDVKELKFQSQEDFRGNYLEFTEVMHEAIHRMRSFNKEVLEPFYTVLARFMNDKDFRKSVKDETRKYEMLKDSRLKSTQQIGKYFIGHGNDTRIKIGTVMSRVSDYEQIVKKVSVLSTDVNMLDINLIKENAKKCVEVLDLILQKVDNGSIDSVSPEIAKSLAIGTFEIASELEYIAGMYYQTLVFKHSVKSMTDVLQSYINGSKNISKEGLFDFLKPSKDDNKKTISTKERFQNKINELKELDPQQYITIKTRFSNFEDLASYLKDVSNFVDLGDSYRNNFYKALSILTNACKKYYNSADIGVLEDAVDKAHKASKINTGNGFTIKEIKPLPHFPLSEHLTNTKETITCSIIDGLNLENVGLNDDTDRLETFKMLDFFYVKEEGNDLTSLQLTPTQAKTYLNLMNVLFDKIVKNINAAQSLSDKIYEELENTSHLMSQMEDKEGAVGYEFIYSVETSWGQNGSVHWTESFYLDSVLKNTGLI